MNFEELGLNDWLLEALSYMGFENATPIQEKTIPAIIEGKDVLACAQTGTGKTAAFILPILHLLADNKKKGVKAMVIAPTRELALQIEQQIQGFAYFTDLRSIAIYGGGDGADWDQQKKALSSGVDIVVATPGRLYDLALCRAVQLKGIKKLVIDEVDVMLDLGFRPQLINIFELLQDKRQNIMFSATMTEEVDLLISSSISFSRVSFLLFISLKIFSLA